MSSSLLKINCFIIYYIFPKQVSAGCPKTDAAAYFFCFTTLSSKLMCFLLDLSVIVFIARRCFSFFFFDLEIVL